MLDILAVTAPIFCLILVGFAAVRFGVLAKADVRPLGLFVINFALPALLFRALYERSLAEIMSGGFLLAYALGSLSVMAAGVAIAYLGRQRSLAASAMVGMGMAFPNSGFIGYPIALQLIGPTASIVLALAMIVENVILLPLTLLLAEGGTSSRESMGSLLLQTFARLIKSPLILAIIGGLTFAGLKLVPPAPIARAIDMLAMASSPVALFVIGGTLVGLQVRGMIGDVALIMAGKLLLHPLAVMGVILVLPAFDPVLQLAAVTIACVPMLSIYPILGQRYGQETLCAAALVATTAASFLTISAILWLVAASGVLKP
jgi:malonate transporter and related proteins